VGDLGIRDPQRRQDDAEEFAQLTAAGENRLPRELCEDGGEPPCLLVALLLREPRVPRTSAIKNVRTAGANEPRRDDSASSLRAGGSPSLELWLVSATAVGYDAEVVNPRPPRQRAGEVVGVASRLESSSSRMTTPLRGNDDPRSGWREVCRL
jgi:hypothetical protein